MLYDLEGELFFGAAPELERCFAEIARRAESQKIAHVILRLKRVRNPDVVCLERLEHFLRTSEQNGLTVLLAGVRPDLIDAFGRVRFAEWISPDRIFKQGADDDSATLAAIRATYEQLRGDKSLAGIGARNTARQRRYPTRSSRWAKRVPDSAIPLPAAPSRGPGWKFRSGAKSKPDRNSRSRTPARRGPSAMTSVSADRSARKVAASVPAAVTKGAGWGWRRSSRGRAGRRCGPARSAANAPS